MLFVSRCISDSSVRVFLRVYTSRYWKSLEGAVPGDIIDTIGIPISSRAVLSASISTIDHLRERKKRNEDFRVGLGEMEKEAFS